MFNEADNFTSTDSNFGDELHYSQSEVDNFMDEIGFNQDINIFKL